MSIGFWIPDDMKGRELTAKDYRRLYETAVGYDRRKVDQRLDDLLFEIQSAEAYLLTVTDDQTRLRIQGEINGLRDQRQEVARLHREDQTEAIDSLHAAFRAWTAVQMDRHNIKARQVAEQLETAIKGMTERERAWLGLRIQQTPHGKDGKCIPIPQRKLAKDLGIGVMTVNRIEAEQERRKEIVALYLSLDIKPRVKRGLRVTTGKKTKAR